MMNVRRWRWHGAMAIVLGVMACPAPGTGGDASGRADRAAELDAGLDAAAADSAVADLRSNDTGLPDNRAQDAAAADQGPPPDTGGMDRSSRDSSAGGDAGSQDQISPDSSTGSDTGNPPPSRYFPAQTFMYQDVSEAALDPDSAAITAWLQDNGGWGNGRLQIDFSIEVLVADASTPYVPLTYDADSYWLPDCDTLDFPVPAGGRLEGEAGYTCTSGGDCHLIVVDRRLGRLFEMWQADYTGGVLSGSCEAVWDMTRAYPAAGRGEQCTSADAAGFPIAPLLFTADEVAAGEIAHAIRFILPNARMRADYYVHPATHAGSPLADAATAPTYGTRWRLKADVDISGLSAGAQVVARALKKYGMLLADGGNIALTAQADTSTTAKWDTLLGPHDLATLEPTDFEVVATDPPVALTYDCVRTPERW